MKAPHLGLLLFGGLSLAVMGGAALFLGRLSPSPPMGRADAQLSASVGTEHRAVETVGPTTAAASDASAADKDAVDARAEALAARLAILLGRSGDDEDEVGRIESEILSLGERAAGPIVGRVRNEKNTARRDAMLDLLRKVPGAEAERGLIDVARSGTSNSSRAIAIEALGDRRTTPALEALGNIARTDRQLLNAPLIKAPRDPNDVSTSLPDEVLFTPRMQAMAALAATGDPLAAQTLTSVLREGPDESLRMEAARNMQKVLSAPGASEALQVAAGSDPSPYVRLSALHSLDGSTDPSLAPVLTTIAARDPDAGVRALAATVLAHLRP